MRPRTRYVLTVGALVTALVTACTGSPGAEDGGPGATSSVAQTTRPPLTGCPASGCEGTIDGARYRILTPRTWNGTLLLYSHGYRFARPVPPQFAPPSTEPVPAPGEQVARQLLDAGYALAGSSYSRNGWAVREGVADNERLYEHFAATVGRPRQVYLWGDSLGGLVTQTLAEKRLPWVSGAAPVCGVLAGTNPNLDLALDVAYGVKRLILPSLRLTGYASHEEAVAQFQTAQQAVVAAATAGGTGSAKVALLSALVDAPDQTSRFDGSTPVSRIGAAVEAAVTGLGYGTYGRYEIEQRVAGNPSTNVGADYAGRVSVQERQLIDLVGGPGTTERLLPQLRAGRVAADAAARSRADELGQPSGRLAVPTLTLHTTDDPLVLVQNERVFADRVGAAGGASLLQQLYVAAPPTFSAPAPYGAGHCAFTDEQRVAVIGLLDRWVRSGTRPGPAVLADVLLDVGGLTTDFSAPRWPASIG